MNVVRWYSICVCHKIECFVIKTGNFLTMISLHFLLVFPYFFSFWGLIYLLFSGGLLDRKWHKYRYFKFTGTTRVTFEGDSRLLREFRYGRVHHESRPQCPREIEESIFLYWVYRINSLLMRTTAFSSFLSITITLKGTSRFSYSTNRRLNG